MTSICNDIMLDSKSEHYGSIQSSLLFGYDFNCDHCSRMDIAAEAIGYCTDCHEYLCRDCYTVHTIPKPSENHITILLTSDPMVKLGDQVQSGQSGSTDTLTDSCTETCPKHPGKVIEFYCSDHNDIGCLDCMDENHYSCENKGEIIDFSKNVETSQIKELTDKIDVIIKSSKSMLKNAQANINKTETNHVKVLKDAHQFVEKVVTWANALEQDFIKESEKIKNDNIARLSQVFDEYSEASEQCQQMISEIAELENSYNTCSLFVQMKKSEKKIQEIKDHLNDINSNNRSTLYKFKPNRDINELLSQTGTSLGCLHEKVKYGHYLNCMVQKPDAIYISSGKKCKTKHQSHGRPYSWAHEVFRREDLLGAIPEMPSTSDA